MAGIKGRSGGRRPGAGRPPKTPRPPADPAAGVLVARNAEHLLELVVCGTLPATVPERIAAARTLVRYQAKPRRAPLPGLTPEAGVARDVAADERSQRDDWETRAAAVRAAHAAKKGRK